MTRSALNLFYFSLQNGEKKKKKKKDKKEKKED